ncbi:MAG: hypothetical protein WC661_03785 [Opitutaceae bacterium]
MDWAGRLEEEKLFLLALVRGIETEFLATGEGLKHLSLQVGEIQRENQTLTDLTLGQTPDAATQFAFQLLKKAEDLVLASYDQYDHVFAAFGEMQRQLGQLSKQHDALMRILLPLNFIMMTVRIEASRQPADVQTVFVALAADVNRMVSDVRVALGRQFEELAASERIAGDLMEQVFTSTQQYRKEISATLELIRGQLHALNGNLSCAGAGASDFSRLNQAVTRHINGIVMAQQCQDIARQKIEHVGEAMDEMRAQMDKSSQAAFCPDAARRFVFQAAQIQLRQAQNVFDELNRAADGLKAGIRSLRTDADAASAAVVKVGGALIDSKIASQCQDGIGRILAIIRQAVQKTADILAAFEPLRARFINCTTQAAELAFDVRNAALNAQVFAIHATDGATLEVLSGRMRVIADETMTEVRQLEDGIRHTAEMVNNLRQRLEDFQSLSEQEQAVLTEESALSQKKLSDLDATVPLLVGSVTRRQEAFAQSIEEVLVNVRFPVTVAEAGSRSIGFFRDLVTWGGEGGPGVDAESATSGKIDLLQAKYTMASERLTHAAALQAVPAPVSPPDQTAAPNNPKNTRPCRADPAPDEIIAPAHPPASKKPAAGEDMGDNVDLF